MLSTVKQVLTNPKGFYSQYAAQQDANGYVKPVIFVVQMAVLSAVLAAIVELVAAGAGSAVVELLQGIVVLPVYSLIICLFLSVGFALLWTLMGSERDFATAFGCVAYSFALLPLWALLADQHAILQLLLLILWAVVLATATQFVHGIDALKAKIALTILVLLAAMLMFKGDREPGQLEQPAALLSGEQEIAVGKAVQIQAAGQFEEEAGESLPANAPSQPGEVAAVETNSQQELAGAGMDNGTGEELGEDVAAVDAEELFTLSPEAAGKKLGELVRGVSEAVVAAGEDFQRGFDSTLEEPADETEEKGDAAKDDAIEVIAPVAAELEAPAVEEVPALEEVPVAEEEKVPTAEEERVPTAEQEKMPTASEAALSPQQLGEKLGQFIREINRVLEEAEAGFESGMAASEQGGSKAADAAERAGKSLGEFVNAFNRALESESDTSSPAGVSSQMEPGTAPE